MAIATANTMVGTSSAGVACSVDMSTRAKTTITTTYMVTSKAICPLREPSEIGADHIDTIETAAARVTATIAKALNQGFGVRHHPRLVGSLMLISPWKSFISLHSLSVEGSILPRSEEHTSELQSRENLVCRLLLEK